MKIVHVGLDIVPSSGGSVVSIRDFSRVGNSFIISFTSPCKLDLEGSAIPGTIHILTSNSWLGRAFAWAPTKSCDAGLEVLKGADLIVCHLLFRYHLNWVQSFAQANHIPYWVVPHGGLDPYVFSYRSIIKKSWLRLIGYSFLEKASRVIFATKMEKHKAERFYAGRNGCVVHWPVEPIEITDRDFAKKAICKKHRIAADEKILIYIGRLHPMKRPLETITAFVKSQVTKTHLILVGPNEIISHQDCLDHIEKVGAKNVHIAGAIYGEKKNQYLLASDAYISLSHRENFGYTVAEALSAGIPVILSPGNDLADELKEVQCGWMLQDGNTEKAAVAIKDFSASSFEQLREMGQRGRYWASHHLCFKHFADQIQLLAAESVRDASHNGKS